MPARLSSLLVRDGLVGVKRMEKAFQRQVIYGGSLDTILLEMNLVPEDRLTQYLALASGLPPAARDEASSLSPDALALLTSDLAQQFRALPLSLDGEALRVLVCSPLQISELEDLADLLDRPLQPLITPEYRWHLAYAKAYKGEAPARFSTLARSLSVEQAPPAVGRAKSVIIEEPVISRTDTIPDPDATAPLVAPPRPPTFGLRDDPTEKIDFKPPSPTKDLPTDRLISYSPPPHLDPTKASGTYTPKPVEPPTRPTPPPPPTPKPPEPPKRPTPPPTTTPDGLRRPAPPQFVSSPPPDEVRVAQTKTLMGLTPPPSVRTDAVTGTGIRPRAPARSVPPANVPQPSQSPPATPSTGIPRPMDGRGSSGQGAGARPVMARTSIEPIATAGRDSPLAVVRARELLATADDRDTVFLTLLRAARARARYAGLLTVQGGAAIGRLALAETGIDVAAIHTVLIPLDAMSPFRTVTQNQQPHIGPLASGDPAVDAMITRMGGSLPPSALLMPIVLRERVVAVVVAHRVHSDLKLVDVTELLPLAAGAADALGRLIVKHKSAGYRAPEEVSKPSIDISGSTIDTKKIKKDAGWSASARPSVPVIPVPAEPPKPVEPPKPIAELIDTIESAAEGTVDAVFAEAVERSQETLGELAKRFPGKLRVDRFAVSGRPLRASQYGGLLDLTVRLGAASGEVIVEGMSSAQRDTRFYATVCAAELRPRNAVFALVERLFDQDFGVRSMAIEALAGYPAADMAHALPRARRALHSSDPETVAAATAALIQLQDIESIDDLIGAIERGDRGSEHARKALVALTAQDFGLSERKWRKWYETGRRKHRIEWLIDGLAHKEDAIRETAINDLRRLTGEYFGYHHDLPKKEREVAAERWQSWWRETGMRRFVTRDDERNRPTGVLPVRRD